MHREPLFFYLFRLLLTFFLVVFLGMLYWSSLIQEERWQKVNRDIEGVAAQLTSIKDKVAAFSPGHFAEKEKKGKEAPEASSSTPIPAEKSYSNLLEEDPFFETTLPHLLGPSFTPQGVLRMATYGRPEHLHPFAQWSENIEWWSLCNASAARAKEGRYETLAPYMATRMEERPSKSNPSLPEYWIFLRRDVFWQPLDPLHFPSLTLAPHFLKKQPVTAHDFKLFYDTIMNPSVQGPMALAYKLIYSDVEEVEVVDDYTFVVRWKGHKFKEEEKKKEAIIYAAKARTGGFAPLPGFVYKFYADGTAVLSEKEEKEGFRTSSLYGQNFNDHWTKNVIVGCGAYLFDGMSDREIRFRRNPEFFFPLAALVEKRQIHFKNSSDAAWEEFKAGLIDYHLLGDADQRQEWDDFLKTSLYLDQKKEGNGAQRLDYLTRAFTYIGWNMARPLFKSKKVRQALTLGIDRARVVRQNLNGMGVVATGSFFPGGEAADPAIKPWPYDPIRARNLLEEEGWFESKGDGLLYKEVEGEFVPFKFKLNYFVKNLQTKSVCEYVATALKQLGIHCDLQGVDLADLSALVNDKDFDAYFLAWGLESPPEDPRQIWHSAGAAQKGSSNTVGFVNKEADAIIDELDYESDKKKRRELYHQFDRIIHEEAPYTFMYVPKIALVYRDRVQNVFNLADRQDLIPGATVAEPDPLIYWLRMPS